MFHTISAFQLFDFTPGTQSADLQWPQLLGATTECQVICNKDSVVHVLIIDDRLGLDLEGGVALSEMPSGGWGVTSAKSLGKV